MKLAYKIVTPILAVGAIAMGIFLKLFDFVIGSSDETLSSIVTLAQNLGVKTEYEYSAFELIKMLVTMQPAESAEGETLTFSQVAAPIIPHIVAFIIFLILTLLVFVAIGVVASATNKRGVVIILSCVGLVLSFVCIIISKLAFGKLTGGEIALSDLVTLMSDSALAKLATLVVTLTSATLSAGFYALFGMFILIIIWTIVANMLIKTPIQPKKKYKRKKPMRRIHFSSKKKPAKAKKAITTES